MVITGAGAAPAVLSATSLANVPTATAGLAPLLMEFFSDCIMLVYAADDGVVEVLAIELLLGDMRFASLLPEPTTEATDGGADEDEDDDGVLVEEITRES